MSTQNVCFLREIRNIYYIICILCCEDLVSGQVLKLKFLTCPQRDGTNWTSQNCYFHSPVYHIYKARSVLSCTMCLLTESHEKQKMSRNRDGSDKTA